MTSGTAMLAVEGLDVSFGQLRGRIKVLDGVSFAIAPGEVLGLVGESGSGKSVTALALMALLGEQGRIDAGQILFEGRDLAGLAPAEMLQIRGRSISMIFQEPTTSLNPVLPVGFQIAEVLIAHLGMGRAEALRQAALLMKQVGIPAAAERVADYPHQMSGGMRQRVMIAMAIACRPRLLIADEPTTALDVTMQAQILRLIKELQTREGMAVLMITHDLGVIARVAHRVAVMYAGQIVETGPVRDIFRSPRHPYTRMLLRSIPRVGRRQLRLRAIAGTTPSAAAMPSACRFHPRCPDAIAICRSEAPPLETEQGRQVRCWRAHESGLISQEAV
jgi:oligopeptide/dipeptide ABC transporter ATP-binding protein